MEKVLERLDFPMERGVQQELLIVLKQLLEKLTIPISYTTMIEQMLILKK